MNKQILRLAIPNILSNISIPLLSTVDLVLMGQLSMLHLGAIGLATMIFNFFFWNFGFLRMGTTGLVAQAYGADDQRTISQILSKGVYLSLGIALLILLLQVPVSQFATHLLNVSDEHYGLVLEYYNIRIWGAPATLLTYCLFGWLFGMQNALLPMIATISINLVNIIVSYTLVAIFDWEIAGAASGTVIAEYLGVILLIVSISYKYDVKLLKPQDLQGWGRFFSVNRDLFIRTIALTTAFGFFYRQSMILGGLVLATNVVLLQFLGWMSYGIDGFAYASESLVGRYVGQKDSKKLLSAINYSFSWGLGLAVCFSIAYGFWGTHLGALFTSDIEVVDMISEYSIWLVILPIVAFTCYIWDGIFIGMTETKMMRDSMLMSLAIYFVVFVCLKPLFDNSIWISFTIFLGIRGIILTLYWRRHRAIFVNK